RSASGTRRRCREPGPGWPGTGPRTSAAPSSAAAPRSFRGSLPSLARPSAALRRSSSLLPPHYKARDKTPLTSLGKIRKPSGPAGGELRTGSEPGDLVDEGVDVLQDVTGRQARDRKPGGRDRRLAQLELRDHLVEVVVHFALVVAGTKPGRAE